MRFSISRIIVCFLALASPVWAAGTELPSQGLEQRVDFWKKIYTQYGKDDVVIHDSFHVNLIYDVASDADSNFKCGAVQESLHEIRTTNLESLPETLSSNAQQVYAAITAQGIAVTTQSLDALSSNIHTQRGIKERFRDGVIRSGRYVEQFEGILKNQGVPTELALLPLVESSFQNARSKAGAVGVWQFTKGTGKLYMKVGSTVDERLDPVKATQAAAKLLKSNYSALGAWPLAITAYNHGRGGMLKAQGQIGSDITRIISDYRGPLFGYASMNFYSEFLAAVEVYRSYPVYFGDLALDTADSPSLKPAFQQAAAAPEVAAATKSAKAATDKYKVRNGDNLYAIAQKFGTSIRDLMQMNNLNHPAIYAGQVLLVK